MSLLLVLSSLTACCSSEKILQLLHILWFSSIFCIFEPFPTVTVWFWDPSFHTEGQLRDSYIPITKGGNICWCSRRQHNALRAKGCQLLNRMMRCNFLILFKDHMFFHLVLHLRSYINIKYFPEDKISQIYPDHPIQNVYTPQLLMHCVAFLSISKCFHLI